MENVKLSTEKVYEMMHQLGIESYDAKVERAESKGKETNTEPVRRMLSSSVTPMAEAVREWTEKARRTRGRKHIATKYLNMMEPEEIAAISCQVILDSVSRERPYLTVANSVAVALEDEVRFRKFSNEFSKKDYWIRKNQKTHHAGHLKRVLSVAATRAEMEWTSWPTTDRYHVGTVCIELFAQTTGLVAVENRKLAGAKNLKGGVRKTQAFVVATERTLEWMKECHNRYRELRPLFLPMVAEPNDWTSPFEGGYDANIIMRWPLIRAKRNIAAMTTPKNAPKVYKAVNALQRTAWQVNDDVYAMFDFLWSESGGGVAGLPPRDDRPLPEKPADIDTNEVAKRDWKRRAAAVYDANAKLASQRASISRTHFVARNYQYQGFYHPMKLDYRNRIYTIPQFLSHMGTDLEKGLLRFERGLPIETKEARDWLAIHGANCYGNDKVSLSERVAWVEENEGYIRSISQDPISRSDWYDVDSPWQFLAFCFEWDALRTAEEKGETFISKLPVQMDGSNNGLQIYSLLLRDSEAGRATNVTPGERRDIYGDVADVVTRKLKADADTADEPETRQMARNWLDFSGGSIPRSATKRPVMVLPYGGTQFSCRQYVEAWYNENESASGLEEPFEDVVPHLNYLSRLVWDSISEVVVAARQGMAWLREVAAICNDHEMPIRWRTPLGFYVWQKNVKKETIELRTKVGEVIRWRNAQMDTNEISGRQQKNGIAPNFIHSLDATVLMETVCRCVDAGIREFAMVHDSYGTHAANAPKLARILRESVADLFAGDLLKDFADQINAQLSDGDTCPPLPCYGDLDPQSVVDSDYFFA